MTNLFGNINKNYLILFILMVSTSVLAVSTPIQWSITADSQAKPSDLSAVEPNDNSDFVSLALVKDMTVSQKRSFYLLQNKYLNCFYFRLSNSSHPELPIEYAITVYEKHNASCGGDSNTMPRHASYVLDQYGRLFKENLTNDNLKLIYKFRDDVEIIKDIDSKPNQFNHPTATVFEQYNLKLNRIEKRAAGTFVTFYINSSPILDNRFTQQPLFNDLLRANGDWDFILTVEDSGEEDRQFYIEGTKRKIIDANDF